MNLQSVCDSQQYAGVPRENLFAMPMMLRPGHVVSLRSRRPMQLKVLAPGGIAWVTRTTRGVAADDLVLAAGQSLDVGAGEHLVMEAATGQPVRYQWEHGPAYAMKRTADCPPR